MPSTQLHLPHSGFSFIESVAVLAVLSFVLAIALPQMRLSLASERAKSTALGVAQFINEAKSIALIRNQKLWIKITPADVEQGEPWSLALAASLEQTELPAQRILYYKGSSELQLEYSYLFNQMFIDGKKGKIAFGYFKLSCSSGDGPTLKVVTSYDAGRVRVCAIEEAIDGFPQC